LPCHAHLLNLVLAFQCNCHDSRDAKSPLSRQTKPKKIYCTCLLPDDYALVGWDNGAAAYSGKPASHTTQARAKI
jgi:hypothetical protein